MEEQPKQILVDVEKVVPTLPELIINEVSPNVEIKKVRKPFVMTEARKLTLEKANQKRSENVEIRRQLKDKYDALQSEIQKVYETGISNLQNYENKTQNIQKVDENLKVKMNETQSVEQNNATPSKDKKRALKDTESKKKKRVKTPEPSSDEESEDESEQECDEDNEKEIEVDNSDSGSESEVEEPPKKHKSKKQSVKNNHKVNLITKHTPEPTPTQYNLNSRFSSVLPYRGRRLF